MNLSCYLLKKVKNPRMPNCPTDSSGHVDFNRPPETAMQPDQAAQETVRIAIEEWQTATLHSLAEVEDLLDTLQSQGFDKREVSVVNNTTFAVRWKRSSKS